VLLVIRPMSVAAGLMAAPVTSAQRRLIGWFGIRGVGSVYYLTYALGRGVDEATARALVGLVFVTIAASVALHGTSVTPLMNWYGRVTGGRRDRPAATADPRPGALDETEEAPA
jgi:NhaP-type Na+/H+ or K+/H+ antiporter